MAIVTYLSRSLMFSSFLEISPANAIIDKMHMYCCCFSVRGEIDQFICRGFIFLHESVSCSTRFLQGTHYLVCRRILLLIYCTVSLPCHCSFFSCYLRVLVYYPVALKKLCIFIILFSQIHPVVGNCFLQFYFLRIFLRTFSTLILRHLLYTNFTLHCFVYEHFNDRNYLLCFSIPKPWYYISVPSLSSIFA
jgi:hypothetical protein